MRKLVYLHEIKQNEKHPFIFNELCFVIQMDKLFYENYKALSRSTDPADHEKEIKKALTLHPYKNYKDMYRIEYFLHENKLKSLENYKQYLEASINEMDEMIKDHFIANITTEVTNKDYFEGFRIAKSTREDILQWNLVNDDVCYTQYETAKQHRIKRYEHANVHKYLNLLKKWIIHKGIISNKISYFKCLNYLYQTLHPTFGHISIFNVRIHTNEGKNENKQYIIKQKFGKLEAFQNTEGQEEKNKYQE